MEKKYLYIESLFTYKFDLYCLMLSNPNIRNIIFTFVYLCPYFLIGVFNNNVFNNIYYRFYKNF